MPHPYTPEKITKLAPNEVFVFGSNRLGWHGGGAALTAMLKFGAVLFCGRGLHGQSYAIPTMHGGPEKIAPYVDEFITYATLHPELHFYVTKIGCGIAGHTAKDIAPLFLAARELPNVSLPKEFADVLRQRANELP